MAEPIDKREVVNKLIRLQNQYDFYKNVWDAEVLYRRIAELEIGISKMPTVDVVSRGCHDQVRWERDIALKQLEEHGIPFGGIAPDVVKVVRCKDCIWFSKEGYEDENAYDDDLNLHMGHCSIFRTGTQACRFCSYGERKDNG